MKLNICILLFISCISCQTSTKEYTQFVNQYLNRQLKLPQHILIKQCSDSIYLQNLLNIRVIQFIESQLIFMGIVMLALKIL
jgi:hypothetical protein